MTRSHRAIRRPGAVVPNSRTVGSRADPTYGAGAADVIPVRRDGAQLKDASALLARFAPGPDRTGRVVLHPRLTIVPLRRDDFEGLKRSFATDVPIRVAAASDLGVGTVAERAAVYDDAIAGLDLACTRHTIAIGAVNAAERTLTEARADLDRVAMQRARADEAIATASVRLAVLERAATPEGELRRELETARGSTGPLADAATRVDTIERALAARARSRETPEPSNEIEALREQIVSVRRSVTAALTTREGQVRDAQTDLDTVRRDAAVAERQLAVMVDRLEPGTDARDADGLLRRMQARRELLDTTDITTTEGLLLLCAKETAAPILLLVEPFAPAPTDLIDALVAVSAEKRCVYVTDDEQVLAAARALDPEVGAIRTALDTGGIPGPALVQPDGNLM